MDGPQTNNTLRGKRQEDGKVAGVEASGLVVRDNQGPMLFRWSLAHCLFQNNQQLLAPGRQDEC